MQSSVSQDGARKLSIIYAYECHVISNKWCFHLYLLCSNWK